MRVLLSKQGDAGSAPAGHMQAATNRKALVFIFVTVAIDMIGMGIIVPVAPKIVMALTHQGYATAAEYAGWLSFTFAAMLLFCAPVVGNLSDRFGRRPVLLASLVALGIDYLITGLAPTIGWLFIGRALSGMAGAAYMTANAYIADVTPPEKRAGRFGLVGAAFSIGFIVGPAIGGLLGGQDPRLPFFVAAAMSLVNSMFGFFVLKETLPPENRRRFDWRRANPFGALRAMWRLPHALSFIAILVLLRLANDAVPSTFAFYCYLKFHWTPGQLGTALMFGAACMAAVSFGTPLAIKRLGEMNSATIGIACGTLVMAGYALAAHGWEMYVWMAVGSTMSVIMPAINAILSRNAGPTMQGELQGALASIGGLTSVVAPPLTTHIFAAFTAADAPVYFPGAAFMTGAVIMAAALAVFLRLRKASAGGRTGSAPLGGGLR